MIYYKAMNNKKPKKIIFIKNASGQVQQAMDLDLYLKNRQQGKLGAPKKAGGPFLLGIPESPKTQFRKKCCGRKA